MSSSVQNLFERLRTGDNPVLGELTPTLYGELIGLLPGICGESARDTRSSRRRSSTRPT